MFDSKLGEASGQPRTCRPDRTSATKLLESGGCLGKWAHLIDERHQHLTRLFEGDEGEECSNHTPCFT